jgi:hypothetical protein
MRSLDRSHRDVSVYDWMIVNDGHYQDKNLWKRSQMVIMHDIEDIYSFHDTCQC